MELARARREEKVVARVQPSLGRRTSDAEQKLTEPVAVHVARGGDVIRAETVRVVPAVEADAGASGSQVFHAALCSDQQIGAAVAADIANVSQRQAQPLEWLALP